MQNLQVHLHVVQAMLGYFKQAPAVRIEPICRFLLDYDRALANVSAADQFADFDFDEVAAAKFTVDREIKKRAIPRSCLTIEPKSYRPNLLWLEGSFASNQSPCIPWAPFFDAWVKF